jgi:hypothetical protein
MVWRGALIRFVGSTLARGQTLENSHEKFARIAKRQPKK